MIVAHVEGGTIGRLIRACMEKARQNPAWRAVGPVQSHIANGATVLRQRLELPEPGDER